MLEAELIHQKRSQQGAMKRVIEGKHGRVALEPGPMRRHHQTTLF